MYKLFEKAMGMDDKTWKRHANPWSVYSRFSILPLLALSVWSRQWIGVYALFPIAFTLFWVWVNPRLFGEPKSLENWASKGVMGEQIFLKRTELTLPKHFIWASHFLSIAAGLGLIYGIYGLWTFDLDATLCGIIISMGAKTWFVDRMVWLYEFTHDQESH